MTDSRTASVVLFCLMLPPASATTPVSVVQAQVEAYNARDLEKFVGLYAKDAAIYRLPRGELIGKGEAFFRQRYKARFDSSPHLHATIHDRIVLGNYVIDREEVVREREEPTMNAVAIYRVDGDRIDRVWFLFDEDTTENSGDNAKTVMARHVKLMTERDRANFEAGYAPDVQVVNLPDGRVLHEDRDAMRAAIFSLWEGDEEIEWRIEKQIDFENFVVTLESVKRGDGHERVEQVVVYQIVDDRIGRCWLVSDGD